jgi:hypothetical protein
MPCSADSQACLCRAASYVSPGLLFIKACLWRHTLHLMKRLRRRAEPSAEALTGARAFSGRMPTNDTFMDARDLSLLVTSRTLYPLSHGCSWSACSVKQNKGTPRGITRHDAAAGLYAYNPTEHKPLKLLQAGHLNAAPPPTANK